MSRTTRHYRAAKKEIVSNAVCGNGIFIKNKNKPFIITAIALFAVILFIKGFVLGWMINRD